ncbi:MAG: C1 family peptidase [Fibromonadaceae bacterium]|jgi:hypothetical protein|nr:C1 family peptidase [Fibromonadaceae bacterium]
MKKILLFFPVLFFMACGEHNYERPLENESHNLVGGVPESQADKEIPMAVFGGVGFSESDLPQDYSWENYFPPIVQQYPFNNCVAWAVGYNLKTALNAIEKKLKPQELLVLTNQTSARDLWLAIPVEKRGESIPGVIIPTGESRRQACHYTDFTSAFYALEKGPASEAIVPSKDASKWGNCLGSPVGDNNNIIIKGRDGSNSRRLGMSSIQNIKYFLTKHPLAIRVIAGGDFTKDDPNTTILNSSNTKINSYEAKKYNANGHAMVLVGYDDNKGNGAFRIRNSWGTSWRDSGSVWVDYNFFIDSLATDVYEIETKPASSDTNKNHTGYNLEVSNAVLYTSKNSREMSIAYDVTNSGTISIPASKQWKLRLVYYNAQNANENEIIYEQYYTNEYGATGQYGPYNSANSQKAMWSNFDLNAGDTVPKKYYPDFRIFFTMPKVTGNYYMAIIADPEGKVEESYKEDNFYFITATSAKPLMFRNGFLENTPANAISYKVLTKKEAMPNAYTPSEIMAAMKNRSKRNLTSEKN